jgi:hypothetical protein
MKKDFTKQDFYDLLEPNGDCLEWTKSTTKAGYGQTFVDGKFTYAHRLALMLEGIDVNGWYVLHSCDNPLCCNTAHLRVGTPQQNSDDMIKRNRHCYGERGTNILSETQVLEIRELFSNGLTQKDIAEMFNTTRQCIWLIVHRKSWTHI